jgi:hypothetical protein
MKEALTVGIVEPSLARIKALQSGFVICASDRATKQSVQGEEFL